MKRLPLLFAFSCLIWLNGFAQKSWMDQNINSLPYRNILGTEAVGEGSQQYIVSYVKKHVPNLSNASDIKLIFQNTSPIGNHFDYVQTWNGIKIFRSEVKINIAFIGKVMSFYEKTINTSQWNFKIPGNADKNMVASALGSEKKMASIEQVIFINNDNTAVPAWQVQFYPEKSYGSTGCVILDENYHTLYSENYAMNFCESPNEVAKDSVVKALVFLPDPITTKNLSRGIAPFLDYNDSAVPAIDSQRKEVNITVQYDKSPSGTDSFYLVSDYIQFIDFDAPFTGVTWRSTPLFDFNRHQYGFEDVNVFYHINVHQKHLHDLGIKNLLNYPLNVDAHCSSLGDNSMFVPDPTNKTNDHIAFGTGGVDDAEDADVIIHEYTHGLRNSASPNTFNGHEERMAAEEGFCDYFACSYSKMLSTNQWQKCFNWDGDDEATTWPGRTCASSKIYPKDMTNEIHLDGEIVSAALMEIADEISRDTCDKLMLTAFYSLTIDMSMRQVMRAFVEADSALFNGSHYKIIECHLVAHGLDTGLCKTGIDDGKQIGKVKIGKKYFSEDGLLNVNFEVPQTGKLILYSADGKLIFNSEFRNRVNLTYDENELAAGMYIVHIITNDGEDSEKLIKLK